MYKCVPTRPLGDLAIARRSGGDGGGRGRGVGWGWKLTLCWSCISQRNNPEGRAGLVSHLRLYAILFHDIGMS